VRNREALDAIRDGDGGLHLLRRPDLLRRRARRQEEPARARRQEPPAGRARPAQDWHAGRRGRVPAAAEDQLRHLGDRLARGARAQAEHGSRLRGDDAVRAARLRRQGRAPARRRRRQALHHATARGRRLRLDAGEASARARHLPAVGDRERLQRAQPRPAATAGERPRATRKEAAYFENEELPRLFAQLDEGIYRPSSSSR
jgi:hypothetical protein